MKRAVGLTFFALLACLGLLAARRAANFSTSLPGDPLEGALIYDNWILALDLEPPAGDQPLWAKQETNTRSGVITWRCVECHGWDYKGASGAYGSYSSHYTGFTGLQDAVGATQEDVIAWLDGTRDPAHNFLQLTNSVAINDLAAFLRTQQVDDDLMIDPFTGASLGDRVQGAILYNQACISCHGENGDQINFGNVQDPLFLGDLAIADPWQTVHKIRFGSPTNGRMPSSEEIGWSLNRVADVLAYTQMLRRGNPEFDELSHPNRPPDVQSQAQVEPIIWGAFAIFALVLFNLGWDSYKQSGIKIKLPKFKKASRK